MTRPCIGAVLTVAASVAACSPRATSECTSGSANYTYSALPRPDGFPTNSAANESRREAITNANQWQAFWSAVMANRGSPRGAPPVDFQQDMVLIAALGQRPTGGYLVSIDEATSDDVAHVLKVRVREVIPGRCCIVTTSLTSPIDAVLVPKSNYPVRFFEEKCVYECACT